MKKNITLLIILFTIFLIPTNVLGLKGIAYNTKLRTCPAANDAICPALDLDDDNYVIINGVIEVSDLVPSIDPDNDGCASKEWYKTIYNEQEVYICSSKVTIINEDDNGENEEPATKVLNTIPSKYDVIAYATHRSEGRVPIVKIKEGITDTFTCDKITIVVDNKLVCVDEYLLSNHSDVVVLNTDEIPYDFEEELAKFPKSYQDKLRQIHNEHPNWRFYAYNTGLDWNEAVRVEKNSSLIQSTVRNESFFDTEELANFNWRTNRYVYHESGVWVTPSKQATAYYLDPRTYLNKNLDLLDGVKDYRDIFVFEDARAYTYQNDTIVNQMLIYGGITGGFDTPYGRKTYRESFMDGSTFSKISPLILISRSRNETGNFKSGSVSGHFESDTGLVFDSIYNFFNVGAYGAYPITNGLIYAKNAGWTDPYKSISEGSIFIGTKYVYNGQETQYFQKFNVSPYTLTSVYGHQYQTNIEAPITEAGFVFWGYYDSGNINQPIVFHIPVYNNMPEEPTMKPKYGNPNNWLLNIKINGDNLANFDGDNYYSFDNNWDEKEDAIYEQNVYSYSIAWDVDTINIEVEKANNASTVIGAGEVAIDETKIIYIKVVAGNETTKTYAIKINKQEMPQLDEKGEPIYPEIADILNNIGVKYNDKYLSGLDLGTTYQTLIDAVTKENNLVSVSIIKNPNNKTNHFATGDIINFKSGDVEASLAYVLYGDTNGDGNIDLYDLVDCRNIILDVSNLKGEYREAADTNKDKKVDLYDLVDIRNCILGTAISQR